MQDGGPTPGNRLRDTHPWFIQYFFDMGHPCYGQSTPVSTRYHLTWIKFIVRRGHVFFKLTADQVQVLFGSRAYDRLTCDKSRVVRKAVNASAGLKKLTEV